jgi:hypothetical protein
MTKTDFRRWNEERAKQESSDPLSEGIARTAEPFTAIDTADLEPLRQADA